MIDVFDACKEVDGLEFTVTVESVTHQFEHMTDCDPFQDMLIADMFGEMIAYSRVMWQADLEGNYIYPHLGYLLPEWRRRGIGSAILGYNENRLREIAADHPSEAQKYFQRWAANTQFDLIAMLEKYGYTPWRHQFEMSRPLNEAITITELPDGLEVRPVESDHYRKIFDADSEIFSDHPGYVPPTDEDFLEWTNSSEFDPELLQIAWDGDKVAGMVLNFVRPAENEEYNRIRGYTEGIGVRRPYRKQGLARALLTRSMKMFQDMGYEETALGVDTQNPSGALRLYKSVGYTVVKGSAVYRKPMEVKT
jgi:ribosomal protein S18 acetylase RimI-like enzyme